MENCVILCGGKSSRMGSNKALLPLKNQTLVEFMYYKMQKVFLKVWLSCKDNSKFSNYPCIYDKTSIFAPLVALSECLSTLKEPIFFMSVDTPLISLNTIEKIIQAYNTQSDFEAFIPTTATKIHPLCGVYTPSCLKTIELQLKNHDFRLQNLLKLLQTYFVSCEDEIEFSNANTQADFEFIVSRIKEV